MLALASLFIWLYLICLHGRFWRSGPELAPAAPAEAQSASRHALPDVDIIVPARDEAETIGPVIASLLRQLYAGRYRVILVDDDSGDATVHLARTAAAGAPQGAIFEVLRALPKPPGWSGKLWAVSQGVERSVASVLLLADADIVHDPRHLATLVARLEDPPVDLVSEMVRLNCTSRAERWLVPAFVYFFQMLYPFDRVNRPGSRVAAAAGGTVLLRREALVRIGGVAAIKGALIDDVTLACEVKRGGAIYLGHSALATSIRSYSRWGDLWDMIARTAFTQLRHSTGLLLLTVVGLGVVWWVPLAAAFLGNGWERACGGVAFVLGAVSFLPTLRRYRRNPLGCITLPLISVFYMAATVGSAVRYWRGYGARWKNRDYGREA